MQKEQGIQEQISKFHRKKERVKEKVKEKKKIPLQV